MSYGIYIAKIVASPATSDNRSIVRVLPHMKNTQDKNCPRWSYFFKDQVYVGKTGELVWVICDDEFSNGFILGPANYACLPSDDFENFSITEDFWKKISDTLVSISSKSFVFSDLKVTFWNQHCIHFLEKSTGGSVIAYDTGTLYIMRENEFLIKIGNNFLKIDKNNISLSTGSDENDNSIALQSSKVRLGLAPDKNALGTMGNKANVSETSPYVLV